MFARRFRAPFSGAMPTSMHDSWAQVNTCPHIAVFCLPPSLSARSPGSRPDLIQTSLSYRSAPGKSDMYRVKRVIWDIFWFKPDPRCNIQTDSGGSRHISNGKALQGQIIFCYQIGLYGWKDSFK